MRLSSSRPRNGFEITPTHADGALLGVLEGGPEAGPAAAVVPARHVDAVRGAGGTAVAARSALVQVLLAGRSHVAAPAGAGARRHAGTSVQTRLFAHG